MGCRGKEDNLKWLFIAKSVNLKAVNKVLKSDHQNDAHVIEGKDPMMYSHTNFSSIHTPDDGKH